MNLLLIVWRHSVGVYTASKTERADELCLPMVDSEYDSFAAQ